MCQPFVFAGDEIVISSTDFSSSQAEKRKIVFCPTCNNFQRRIDSKQWQQNPSATLQLIKITYNFKIKLVSLTNDFKKIIYIFAENIILFRLLRIVLSMNSTLVR
jgi:hypothetical protein